MIRAHILGRVAKDPESRYTPGGDKVTTIIVASNSYRAGTEETIWWRVSLWGDRWDKKLAHFTKGKPIIFGGKMHKPRMYTDKNGAQQVAALDIDADFIEFVPINRNEQGQEGHPGAGEYQQYSAPAKAVASGGKAGSFGEAVRSSSDATSFGQEHSGYADSEHGDDESIPF